MKTWIEIDREALRHNYQAVAALVAPAKVMATVKANAYGHGLREVGEALKGTATHYVVDRVEEGIVLRSLGISEPILVLGFLSEDEIILALETRLDLAVFNFSFLQQIHFTTQEKGLSANVHLEVETGLHRTGLTQAEFTDCLALIKEYSSLRLTGLFTHFSNAEEDPTFEYVEQQLKRFRLFKQEMEAAGHAGVLCHTACSAAAFGYAASHFDAIRLGISLYGHWSSDLTQQTVLDKGLDENFLKPVLTWKAVVSQIRQVKTGEPIGYDRTELTARDSTIVTLPIGYYDSYPRSLSSVGHVVLAGQRCRVIGRICMNVLMIDATDVLTPLTIGQEVTLIGEGITAEEVAKQMGTINYELLARLPAHIPRRLI